MKLKWQAVIVFFSIVFVCAFSFVLVNSMTLQSQAAEEPMHVFTTDAAVAARFYGFFSATVHNQQLTPGTPLYKELRLENTSAADEYAAIRLRFYYGDRETLMSSEDVLRFLNLADISWGNGWALAGGAYLQTSELVTKAANELIFVCNEAVDTQKVSAPLFSEIRIKATASDEDILWLQHLNQANQGIFLQADAAVVNAADYQNALHASEMLTAILNGQK